MSKAIDILSKALSILLYPLFIPTYGMVLFCCALPHPAMLAPMAWVWTAIAVGGTFLLTVVLPLTAIFILRHRGKVTDLQIEKAKERTLPYLYAVTGFGFWCYLLISVLHAPLYICSVAVGATVALGVVTVINKRWKISAHLTGFGGFTGGLMSYFLGTGIMPSWGVIALCMALSLLLMYARLRLHAHTPEQVAAGWLLGIACTFIPYCIVSYVV